MGPSPFITPLTACRGRAHGNQTHKRRLSPVSEKQAPIQMRSIKTERPRCIALYARVAP